MPSPDVSNYVDLTVYDADAESLYDSALAAAETKLPEWNPREDNTEVVLLEALAAEVAEMVYAVNRLPGGIVETLLRLYGLTRDEGRQPNGTVTVTVADTLGHTIPAGTRFLLTSAELAEPVELALDADLVIAPATDNATGALSGIGRPTGAANGTDIGTRLTVLDPLPYVNRAELATELSGGADAEDGQAFLDRGIVRLRRLVDTLVRADQFTAAALEQVYVARATARDLTTPDVIATPTAPATAPSATGGTLAAGTYSYRVSAYNADGETLASATATATTTGATGSVVLTWAAPSVPAGVDPIAGYRIYGRTGTLTRRADVGAGVLTWTDTGAAGTGQALPTANTTGQPIGDAPGHVAVAVAGPGGTLLSSADKTALNALLTAQALANLDIHVTDITLTTVNVATDIVVKPDYVDADVTADVEAAVRGYLNPDTWEWGSTVYRFELISLIDQVAGVERVSTVTLNGGTADVSLAGVGPLVTAGTVTVTVV